MVEEVPPGRKPVRANEKRLKKMLVATSSHHSPRQLAQALLIGTLLGLIPKANLLAVLLFTAGLVWPTHLLLLLTTAIGVSCFGPLLQVPLGQLGLWSLTQPQLASVWKRLDRLPIVPWLALHNTVVNGAVVVWLAASVPVYLVSRRFFERLMGDSKKESLAELQELRPMKSTAKPASDTAAEPARQLTFKLNKPKQSPNEQPRTHVEVVHRASELSQWAEEAINDLLEEERTGIHQRIDDAKHLDEKATPHVQLREVLSNADRPIPDEQWLMQTTMEVMRIAEKAVEQIASTRQKLSDTSTGETNESSRQEPTAVTQPGSAIMKHDSAHAGGTRSPTLPREEALHYLLRHLKGIQENAEKK